MRTKLAQPEHKTPVAEVQAQPYPAVAVAAPQPQGLVPALLKLQRIQGNRFVQRYIALDRKANGAVTAGPAIETAIQQTRGAGQPLEPGVCAPMEQVFGADFGAVRVHTDTRAAALNEALGARAFTTGKDLFFAQGEYNPGNAAGRELLAHELTHVLQQSEAPLQGKLTVSQPNDECEREADQVAHHVISLLESPVSDTPPVSQHVDATFEAQNSNAYPKIPIQQASPPMVQGLWPEIFGGAVGGVIGGVGGFILGGPAGAAIGAVAGTALGAALGHLLARKTLTLNITKVDGATRSTAINDASKILEDAANVTISVGKVQTLDNPTSVSLIGNDLVLDEYSSPGNPTAEEIALTAVNRSPGTITAYFVKALSAGSHGEAFWPAAFSTIPPSVALKDGDSPFVAGKPLAHELCHVLLDQGTHPSDVKNLMSYSNDGVGLTPDEATKVRSSPFVK